jgi:hypothetical protein
VRYDEFLETMLENLSKLRPENVLSNRDERTLQAKMLRDAVAGLVGKVAAIDRRIDIYQRDIGEAETAAQRARSRKSIVDLEAEKVRCSAELLERQHALHEAEKGEQTLVQWQKGLEGLKKAIGRDVDTRVRLSAHLKDFIDRVEVFAKGHEDNLDHVLGILGEVAPELERAENYRHFVRYARSRILSADGRFYRLHLRSAVARANAMPDTVEVKRKGNKNRKPLCYAKKWFKETLLMGIPIAPASSLAAHTVIRNKESKSVWPKFAQLMGEFFDGRKPGTYVPKASIIERLEAA